MRLERKSDAQLKLMRQAGLVVAQALAAVKTAVAAGVTTKDLDRLAYKTIREQGAIPSFLGYDGFPATLCTSVNDCVVHAIPSDDDVLAEGDVISIDCGAIVDGWHGDAAITVCVGGDDHVSRKAAKLVKVTEDALNAGITAMQPGARLSDISHAIESEIRRNGRYGIVKGYGGHGIGTEMHQDPFVANDGRPGKGPRLEPGVTLAIEPMVTLGAPTVKVLSDGWTVATKDGSLAAHWEHTVAVTESGPRVLTSL